MDTKRTMNSDDALTGGRQCIWMEAGVVNYKLCPYSYACNLCAFDKAMKMAGSKPRESMKISWPARMRDLSGPEKYCRHMLQGMVSYKLCPNNYECATCAYDQMIQDTIGESWVPDFRQIAGFKIPLTFHYHRKHAWVNVEYGGKCRVGFDDFSSRVLGSGHQFLLPKIGHKVKQNQPFMAVKAADREFELTAPIDGVVTAINPLHTRNEELDPYTEGWVAFIEPGARMPANLKKLYYGEKAMEWLHESADKLVESLTPGLALAADGGIVIPELYSSLPNEKRVELIQNVVLAD